MNFSMNMTPAEFSKRMALLSIGAFITAFSCKALAMPQGLVFGGLSGAALLAHEVVGGLTTGQWLMALNIPIFLAGLTVVGRGFFLASVYGMLCLSFGIDIIDMEIQFSNPVIGAMASGTVMGFGTAIALMSQGSQGGTDIVARCLHRWFSVPVGRVYLGFDIILFGCAVAILGVRTTLLSLTVTAAMAFTIDMMQRLATYRLRHAHAVAV